MSGPAKVFRKVGADPLSRALGIEGESVGNKIGDWLEDVSPSRLVPKPPKVKMPEINIPKAPKPPAPMPLPDDEAVDAAQRKSMATQRRRSGRRSTIYTAASGGLLGE